MLDLALDFEKLVIYLDWKVLVIPGAMLLLLGLLLWLTGSRAHRLFASIFIGLFAAITASLFNLNLVAILVSGFAGVVFGAILDKKAILISAGISSFLIAVFCVYYFGIHQEPALSRYYSGLEKKLNFADSVEFMEEYSVFMFNQSKIYFISLKTEYLAISIGAGIVFMVTGWFFVKTITTIVCSFWGTLLISEGMAWLLLYKGTKVATRVNENFQLYLYIFAGMVIFGFVVQRILCPPRFKKAKTSDKSKENNNENGE